MSYFTDTYNQDTIIRFAEAAYLIKDADEPDAILDTIFDIQNEILKSDFVEQSDKKERVAIAFHLMIYRDFIRTIKGIELIKK